MSELKLLWRMFKDDWGVIVAVALPILFLIGFFVWYETKEDAKVYPEVVSMSQNFDAIRHFEYKGHRYIWVVRYNLGGLVHDPDCPCHHIVCLTNIEWQSKSAYCAGE